MKNCSFEMPPAYSPAVLGDVCQLCGITNQYPVLARTAETISNDAVLAEYACKLYKEFTTGVNSFSKHLVPVDKLGDAANQIFFLTVLSALPVALERYRKQGTPEEIIAATLDFSNLKTTGLQPVQLNYCRRYYRADIYRLGRFHFTLTGSKRNLPALLINKRDRSQKILLANDQTLYDEDGFMNTATPVWIARCTIADNKIQGHVINPDGTVRREQTVFDLTEWSLQYGARELIDMHIPAGGDMTPELSKTSLQKAFEFFGSKYQVIFCDSWIFNPDLRNLAGTGNITSLSQMGSLFTTDSTGKDGMFFLFGTESDDLTRLPRNTTLQRSVIDFMQRGGKLRSSGIFFYADEILQPTQGV